MIWYFLSLFIISIVGGLFDLLHIPIVTTLPWGIDENLVSAVGYFHAFGEVLWWMEDFFIYGMIYFGFLATMKILRFFRLIPAGF